tara:strand:+ start:353 stop:598 length:246 start_codon:yes stop_codon:yes gene_type:complete
MEKIKKGGCLMDKKLIIKYLKKGISAEQTPQVNEFKYLRMKNIKSPFILERKKYYQERRDKITAETNKVEEIIKQLEKEAA